MNAYKILKQMHKTYVIILLPPQDINDILD